MSMDLYDEARAYAAEAEQQAQAQAELMTLETLRREYVALTGMVAYYTKMEREMAKPRLHMDAMRDLLVKLKADELIRQYEEAVEMGAEVTGNARVPAKPLIELLERVRLITR